MKVVIFCGGLGVRMGEETQRIPKRSALWYRDLIAARSRNGG